MIRGVGFALALVLALGVAAVTQAVAEQPPVPPGARAERLSFDGIPGWAADDHRVALRIVAQGCVADPPLRGGAAIPADLTRLCRLASGKDRAAQGDRTLARRFFEANFAAWRIHPADGSGFMTGYFEPEFEGSLTRS